MKVTIILLIIIAFCSANRFMDQPLLRSHHKHPFNLDNPLHQKIQNEVLKVHLIPHSHDDVGWLKTVDEYYFGQHNNIQWAGVQYIIDSYVFSLLNDPTKKFIQVEIAFFKKWWLSQNDHMKDQVKGLIKSGQLEFINGGWCMNDEATTYYEDIIDQMTLGHKFLLDTFGIKPTIGWHIDPFGHQSSQASIFSQMGFNGWFFSRIDYQDKTVRLNNQGMEMIMRPFQMSGEDNSIFSHVNYFNYAAPPSFDYNGRSLTEPIVDNINSLDYNLKSRAEQFMYYFRNQTVHYRGNIVMHTMGEDFQWDQASIYFKNVDKLLKYINDNKDLYNMDIFYSTPGQYLKDINTQGQSYPTKDDDFFPYADVQNGYWTGYFTSRVAIKGITRYYGRYSQFVHYFFSFFFINVDQSLYVYQNKNDILVKLNKMDEALGILQHHDAVAGTAKQHVNDDYVETILNSVDQINDHVKAVLSEISIHDFDEKIYKYQTCQWNTTAADCEFTYKELFNNRIVQITVLETKSTQKGQTDKIRVKVPNLNIRIINQENQPVEGEIICPDDKDRNNCELYFLYVVKDNNPLELQYYRLIPANTNDLPTTTILQPLEESLFLNSDQSIYVKLGNAPGFSIKYGYYQSYQDEGQKSGAYIFRPVDATDQTIAFGQPLKRVSYDGKILKALFIKGTQTSAFIKLYNIDWLSQTYEIESLVDSIPIEDGIGKEVVMLIDTQINNQKVFYTDSNGLELQKRVINFRPTWDLQVLQPSSGNYYPVNGMILIEDPSTQEAAALINDRCQGGTSLRVGQIEMMIHRRLTKDDSRGVGEPLNETEVSGQGLTQRVLHQLTFFNKAKQPNQHRQLQLFLDLPAYTFLSLSESKYFPQQNQQKSNKTILQILNQQNDLSYLVKFQLQSFNSNTYLLRIQNLQEVGDYPFKLDVPSVETTLTGNQLWADWQKTRMNWTIDGQTEAMPNKTYERDNNLVKPLQIRTFLLTFPSQDEQ